MTDCPAIIPTQLVLIWYGHHLPVSLGIPFPAHEKVGTRRMLYTNPPYPNEHNTPKYKSSIKFNRVLKEQKYLLTDIMSKFNNFETKNRRDSVLCETFTSQLVTFYLRHFPFLLEKEDHLSSI